MIFVQIKMQKYNFFCYLKKKLYLCITISERVIALNDWKSGEVPEWSNGAVSKTVDQLAGPRVRIPASPLMKISQVPVGKLVSFFCISFVSVFCTLVGSAAIFYRCMIIVSIILLIQQNYNVMNNLPVL